ncbi:MAG: CoA transferase [Pseudohongiella sp.]|nr:MAG: CoA transferase [Pseudohongiella sp.]
MNNAAPLKGITVVSLEHAIAAPLCTRQLAELGARVIKVERRETGDFARHYDDRVLGQSSHFVWTNRSKQSLTLNLKHKDSTQILQRLLETSDVLVQNLAPGATRKLGLDFEQLHQQYEQLIVCNISGYGPSGPYENKKAYDLLVQAEAGFLSITGTENEMAKSGISIADIAAGMQAQTAILAALIQRAKTNKGSNIEISLLEAMVEWMGFPLNYAYDDASPPPRTGSDHASIYPYGAFATNDDKTIMLGIQNEREWTLFCENVLNQPKLSTDRRFANNVTRSSNREALKAIIEETFSNLSAIEVCEQLDQAQIANANVNDMPQVWSHPQLQALNRIIETETPAGPIKSFKPPGNNSSYKPSLGPVPALGEHTEEILSDLGFEASEIKRFQDEKVV